MIKKVFDPGNYPQNINLSLLLLRIAVGILMLTHGIGKFEQLAGGGPIEFADPIGIGVTPSLTLTVFAEVFCSLFLILGVATRLAAIPLLITMLVAAFVIHIDHGFVKQELALFYATVYLVIVISGAGRISFDSSFYRILNRQPKKLESQEIL